MSEALRFFQDFEAVIYLVLGLGGILYFVRFWVAWQELRGAVFGLERESAQQRLSGAALVLFLLFALALTVFSLVTFVAPSVPALTLMATPTLNLLETPAAALAAEENAEAEAGLATATPLPTLDVSSEGCLPGVLEFSSPEANETIGGQVQISGTVSIENFGFYKFEVARVQDGLWLTIQADRQIRQDEPLVESWDTSRLPPGDYLLQLVVTDNNGDEMPPCRIPVRIEAPQS